jgi:transcription elongation factor Elf1
MQDHPKIIEKRHFTCKKCGYKVQVHGEMYFDYGYDNFIATFSCKRCNILFEGITGSLILETRFRLKS